MKHFSKTVRQALASRWGPVTLAATDSALVWVGFDGQKHAPDTSAWSVSRDNTVLRQAAEQLQQYFAGERTAFALPLNLDGGTPFQQGVWRSLLDIALGATSTYGAIGQAIGNPKAVRAVGAAVGRNPISIIVPCHRVLGSDGSLTGYAGGVDRKQALLQLEGAL